MPLLDEVRQAIRVRHYSCQTEGTYLGRVDGRKRRTRRRVPVKGPRPDGAAGHSPPTHRESQP